MASLEEEGGVGGGLGGGDSSKGSLLCCIVYLLGVVGVMILVILGALLKSVFSISIPLAFLPEQDIRKANQKIILQQVYEEWYKGKNR